MPKFRLAEGIDQLKLARMVNVGMLDKSHPEGWLNYLKSYMLADRLVDIKPGSQDTNEDPGVINSVLLKLLNFGSDRYSYIIPSQILDVQKFHSKDIKYGYCIIKVSFLFYFLCLFRT